MPYIPQEIRLQLDDVAEWRADTAGELNYVITKVIDEYARAGGLSYQRINDVLGALEGAKLEFYRRVAVPYENTKLSTNGDVYS